LSALKSEVISETLASAPSSAATALKQASCPSAKRGTVDALAGAPAGALAASAASMAGSVAGSLPPQAASASASVVANRAGRASGAVLDFISICSLSLGLKRGAHYSDRDGCRSNGCCAAARIPLVFRG